MGTWAKTLLWSNGKPRREQVVLMVGFRTLDADAIVS